MLVSQYSDCVLGTVLFSASEQLELLLELTKIMILLCHIQAAIGKLLETWMRKVMTFLKELLVYLLKETIFLSCSNQFLCGALCSLCKKVWSFIMKESPYSMYSIVFVDLYRSI